MARQTRREFVTQAEALAALGSSVANAETTARDTTLKHVMHNNIWITTSGMFDDPYLTSSIETVGADRILFGTDYPYESMTADSEWFDNSAIDEQDKQKIARGNACSLIPQLCRQ